MNKILFCPSFVIKKNYFYKQSFVFRAEGRFFFARSSIITNSYVGSNVYIYSGKKWHTRFIIKWMVGHKFGEFTWNRKIAIYKAKQLRKKKNKKLKKKN